MNGLHELTMVHQNALLFLYLSLFQAVQPGALGI